SKVERLKGSGKNTGSTLETESYTHKIICQHLKQGDLMVSYGFCNGSMLLIKRLDFSWKGDNRVDLLVQQTKYITSGLFDLFRSDPWFKQGTNLSENQT
ncbi:hypothetical protein WG66_003243, partial [Moniliophthora roreri]